MLTFTHVPSSEPNSEGATALTADYAVFERRRTERRQYMKAVGGMAIVVLLGAASGRVPAEQAGVVAGLLLAVPATLAILEGYQWRRLVRRLEIARGEVKNIRKS